MDKHPISLTRFKSYEDDVTSYSEREAFDRAVRFTKEYEQSDGYLVENLFDNLARRNSIVNRNYQQLEEVLQDYQSYGESLPYDVGGDKATEFTRCLSNYLGSNKNRENQTRDHIFPQVDEICSSDPCVSEIYEEKVCEFNIKEIGYFFTGLRNHLVHEAVLFPTIVLSDEPSFSLDKQRILESDDWSQEGKGYAATWDDSVPIVKLVREYHESLTCLYQWLFRHVNDRFKARYEASVEKGKKAVEAQDEFFDKSGKEMMRIQWKTSDDSDE